MESNEIRARLFALQDTGYRAFHSGLIPGIAEDCLIGVRTPALRALAKEIVRSGGADAFLRELPHRYYEENNLHALLAASVRDYDVCLAEVERFLPYIDNWATCDIFHPAALGKKPERLFTEIPRWLSSPHIYTVRFGICMLMRYGLDAQYRPEYLQWAAEIKSEEYYIRMGQAWFFATALAKQYADTVPYLEQRKLPEWVHRKTIQKACESYRVAPEQKAYLKTLK